EFGRRAHTDILDPGKRPLTRRCLVLPVRPDLKQVDGVPDDRVGIVELIPYMSRRLMSRKEPLERGMVRGSFMLGEGHRGMVDEGAADWRRRLRGASPCGLTFELSCARRQTPTGRGGTMTCVARSGQAVAAVARQLERGVRRRLAPVARGFAS